MMFGDQADESFLQSESLVTKTAASQAGQRCTVSLARDERLQHRAPGGAQHVGGYVAELNDCRLQYLLHAIRCSTMRVNQLTPCSCQLAQLANVRLWNKAAAQQAVFQ